MCSFETINQIFRNQQNILINQQAQKNMNFQQPFSENLQFYTFTWEQHYSQLLFSYYQLSQNYRSAVNKNIQLTEELKQKNQIFIDAQRLLTQNCAKAESKKTLPEDLDLEEETIKEQEKIKSVEKLTKKKRSQRRIKSISSNQYLCSYLDCNRCYDSSVSLNLHIKLKHNGGTKKQRQTYAKMIIDAEEKGLQPPKINICFPPNFIQDFRISYQYMKKYSM